MKIKLELELLKTPDKIYSALQFVLSKFVSMQCLLQQSHSTFQWRNLVQKIKIWIKNG